jgi:hypothetical protein
MWTKNVVSSISHVISKTFKAFLFILACWCIQISCMNILVYWCIFQHIKMLLDVIIKFCIDLWGFSIDPPYFGYNFARQENLFCVFWHFRNLPELQLTWDFSFVNIWSQEAPRAQEVNEVGHEAQKSTCGMVTMPDHTTYACLALEPPMSSVFISYRLAWPKNVYRKTPRSVLVRRCWRNTKPRNRGCFSEDWRGKHCRSRPIRFSNLSDITNAATMIKRE